jgi:hypothetical protein
VIPRIFRLSARDSPLIDSDSPPMIEDDVPTDLPTPALE